MSNLLRLYSCVRHGVLYVRCVETEKTSSFHFKLTNASNAEVCPIVYYLCIDVCTFGVLRVQELLPSSLL
jgi:hypothetical protein